MYHVVLFSIESPTDSDGTRVLETTRLATTSSSGGFPGLYDLICDAYDGLVKPMMLCWPSNGWHW